ncbi:MAG: right-handed parallel beta-helix repeat-containing protein [Euryarchaeota archaeon]|nr:right-handed parallel beta-helix repeat-containing protein [Euryarchaeota archaeon]
MRVKPPAPLLLIVLLSLSSLTPGPQSAEAAPSFTADPHPSITITGDLAFGDLFSGVRTGSGTAADPYVISDWHIHKTRPWGIRLIDTEAHVLLQDLFFHGAAGTITRYNDCFPPVINCDLSSAIWLDRAKNVTVRDVHIVLDDWGLFLSGAERITIEDLRLGPGGLVAGGLRIGVHLEATTNVTMRRVTATSTNWPLAMAEAADTTLEDSTFTRGQVALGVGDHTTRTTLRGNTFTSTPVWAFGIQDDLLIVDNTFNGGTVGLGSGGYPGTSFPGLHVCGNTFTAHRTALEIPRGDTVTIAGNTFDRNKDGVRVAASVDGPLIVSENRVTRSTGHGLDLRVATQSVKENHLHDNAKGHILAATGTDAVDNWWGDPSGPSGIGAGSGDALDDHGLGALYSPWLSAPPTPSVSCP